MGKAEGESPTETLVADVDVYKQQLQSFEREFSTFLSAAEAFETMMKDRTGHLTPKAFEKNAKEAGRDPQEMLALFKEQVKQTLFSTDALLNRMMDNLSLPQSSSRDSE